jgi:hypothetical protein
MTESPSKPDPVARYRAVLETLDPRLRLAAKLRALFPMIEPQIAAGVPHAAVMEDLAQAGLPVHRSTYMTTLRRWRKVKRLRAAQVASATAPAPCSDHPEAPRAAPSSSSVDAIQGRPHGIETPSDLRQIRHMRVDLEALRREGLEQRQKATNPTPQDKE